MKPFYKKIIASLVSGIFALGSFGTSTTVFAAQQKGDINNDGAITILDARKILRFAAELEKPTATEKIYADYDGDGFVTTKDANEVLKYSLDITGGDYRKQLSDLGFPESYLDALVELHKRYPNWRFTPFITGLDWSEAVAGEHSPHYKQLVENNVSSIYKCDCPSCNGVFQESGWWVSASEYAVVYYLDPRNFLSEQYIFQFEDTTYSSTQTIDGIEAILSGTWMYKSNITYKDAEGNVKTYTKNGKAVKYSTAVMDAAKASGMSAYYLASKIVQEVGGYTASAGGASGTVYPYKGIYNYYNIGAYTGALDGLEWANGYMCVNSSKSLYKTASTAERLVTLTGGTELYYIGASGDYYKVKAISGSTTYTGYIKKSDVSFSSTYGRPWSDPYKSIYYGAQYIYSSFSQYQYTGYLQKFNVNKASDSLYSHEYMGNIQAAASEAEKTYYAYTEGNILSSAKNFSIPVFKNMPNKPLSFQEYFEAETVTNLKVSSATSSSVTLKWNRVNNATGYRVYKYNTSLSKYEKLKDVTSTTYTDTTVKKGQTVKYVVRAGHKVSGSLVYWNAKYPSVSYTVGGNFSSGDTSCPYSEPTLNLAVGATGNGVKWLQWYLCKLGYISSESDIDGVFGTGTKSAVLEFQKDAELEVDGIVGPATRTALKNALN